MCPRRYGKPTSGVCAGVIQNRCDRNGLVCAQRQDSPPLLAYLSNGYFLSAAGCRLFVTWLRCNSSCVDPFTTRNRSLPIGRGVSMAACHHTSNASRCAMPQRVSVLVAGTFARYFSSACEQLIAPMTRQVCAVGVRLRSRVRLRLGLGLGLGLG